MKTQFFLLSLFIQLSLYAQTDTLLFENFETDPALNMALAPSGDDQKWVNWDGDGHTPWNSGIPKNWFQTLDFGQIGFGALDSNYVFASTSYFLDPSYSNNNWLILPPLHIIGNNASLHWKSAPFRGPSFMDGYLVLVSSSSNDPSTGDFTDTLFKAAETIDPPPYYPTVLTDSFHFSAGYIHANAYSDTAWFKYPPIIQSFDTYYISYLEPHEKTLSQFQGKTIYIAFVHNSQDDDFISVDDILVLGTTDAVSRIPAFEDPVIYPNPATRFITLDYHLNQAAEVLVQILSEEGAILQSYPAEKKQAGNYNSNFDLMQLPAGNYFAVLKANDQSIAKAFIKR